MYTPLAPDRIPEGVYPAALVAVSPYQTPHGSRVALTFQITTGPNTGAQVTQTAAQREAGKLAALLAGVGGTLHGATGRRCQVRLEHGTTRSGRGFVAVVETFPPT